MSYPMLPQTTPARGQRVSPLTYRLAGSVHDLQRQQPWKPATAYTFLLPFSDAVPGSLARLSNGTQMPFEVVNSILKAAYRLSYRGVVTKKKQKFTGCAVEPTLHYQRLRNALYTLSRRCHFWLKVCTVTRGLAFSV